jgi:hypothetical protein
MFDSPQYFRILKSIEDYLRGIGTHFTAYPGKGQVHFSAIGEHCEYPVEFHISSGGEYIDTKIHYPFRVADKKLRPSVAELVTRANNALFLGKFDMSMDKGTISFREVLTIDKGEFTEQSVPRAYMIGLGSLDRYFPAFMQHMYAGYTPEDAVFHSELDTYAELVEDTQGPKVKPKTTTQTPKTATPKKPPTSPRKPRHKKSEGKKPGQGELPI